jgi:hypothetical protein
MFLKEQIQIFQCLVCCLRIEAVDEWHKREIEDIVNVVITPTDICDTRRSDLNYDEVRDPIWCDTHPFANISLYFEPSSKSGN